MKRLYHMIALLSLINLFAIGGLMGFLFATGKLNAERVDQMAMVLRGEFPTAQSPATQPVESESPPQRSREEIVRIQAQKEYYALIAGRHERELADRGSLNQSIQLDVTRKLEQIETKQKEFREERKKVREETQQDGFQHALEIYSSMDSKLAKNILREKKDPDVVRLLMAMDENRRKKIVNTCKADDDRLWIGRILNQIQQLNGESANGVDGPIAASR